MDTTTRRDFFTRRDFLQSALLTPGLPLALTLLLEQAGMAAAPGHPSAASAPIDRELLRFWTRDVRDAGYAARTRAAHARGLQHARGASRGAEELSAIDNAAHLPVFYVWDADKGFRRASDIKGEEMLPYGDVGIQYALNTFKASVQDREHQVKVGNLRIDVRQATPLPAIQEPLSWTTITGLALHEFRLPALIKEILDTSNYWGGVPAAVLPGGRGYWALNLLVQERPHQGFLDQVLNLLRQGTEAVGLIASLGLPAVSRTAFHTVDTMYAAMNAVDAVRTHNLFKSADTPVVATHQAMEQAQADAALSGEAPLPLYSAKYVAVPWAESRDFEAAMSKLTLKSNYIVDADVKDTSGPGLEEAAVGNDSLKNVTYLTVGVAVHPTT